MLIYKFSILNDNLEDKYIYVKPNSPTSLSQINRAYDDFNRCLSRNAFGSWTAPLF